MTDISKDFSLYIHIPFCRHRCAYCDFNTYSGQEYLLNDYVMAVCNELELIGKARKNIPLKSIFFGGGTPSLISPHQYQLIFDSINRNYFILPDAEISLEANPGTVDISYLKNLKNLGFNRISFGVQSANPEELKLLERIHTYQDVIDVYRWSRRAGFDNLNFDLIYGLPEQSLESWKKSLQLIAGLSPEHISAYALTIEHGTPFGKWAAKGLIPAADPDLGADQYELTMNYLSSTGYNQYEISNWAKPGLECQHNLQYWHNHNYLGVGAGAHGYVNGCRYSNVLRIKTYIDRMKNANIDETNFPSSNACVSRHVNNQHIDIQETLMTGLRLTSEGIGVKQFSQRFGINLHEKYGKEIDQLIQKGLLENKTNPEGYRLTKKGRLLGNQVFMQFVD